MESTGAGSLSSSSCVIARTSSGLPSKVAALVAPFEEGRLVVGAEPHAHGPAVFRSATGPIAVALAERRARSEQTRGPAR
jgi:hypothetical protein